MTISAAAHHLARHPDADESKRWTQYARATIAGRPELRAAIDRLSAQLARAFGDKGVK
jgi:hypothetical protein